MACTPFEGPEKLLEIWFAPSPADVPDAHSVEDGRSGLRSLDPSVWEDMLQSVKCQVLSLVRGDDIDAYLLSESSLFISPHRLILKTCGTTLNLLGLPKILDIAANQAQMPNIYRCFYSRKSFMFPDRQSGPHRDWMSEIAFLDNIFHKGAAYTVGKVNGDHWLLYLTDPLHHSQVDDVSLPHLPDYTIEILMSDLSQDARAPFWSSTSTSPAEQGQIMSSQTGITGIFPKHLTTLDAYAFSPCGYSANALVKWENTNNPEDTDPATKLQEGYYNIHVTPEEGWSYASFECNIPLPVAKDTDEDSPTLPDLRALIRRVISIFQPSRLSLTLFISKDDDAGSQSAVEEAQNAFYSALAFSNDTKAPIFKRTDKINYEFRGYDLAFASFEKLP